MSMMTRPRSRPVETPTSAPSRRIPSVTALSFFLVILVPAPAPAGEPAPSAPEPPPRLGVVERSLAQDQGSWVVDYRLRYHGKAGVVVTPTEVLARLDGWVSNSRIAAHSTPRASSLVVSGADTLVGNADVVLSADDAQRCRERAQVQIRLDAPADPAVLPASTAPASGGPGVNRGVGPVAEKQPILSIAPGDVVRVRLRLDHLHHVFGEYDPLLGVRTFELTLGPATLRDTLPLDREQYFAQPNTTWPEPPEDRRDTRYFMSAPDSLHLEAHVPGNQYYRFPERPVRYAAKMRLSFYYFIAGGTEGECRARIAQYKETPTQWRSLYDGCREESLDVVGKWVKVERVFCTERDATSLALDFRISGSDVGEMWIDDVVLEPIACPRPCKP